MTKKLLVVGTILTLSLLLTSCGASDDAYFIGDQNENNSSNSEQDSSSNAPEQTNEEIALEILEVEKELTIEAEPHITGTIESGLKEANEKLGKGKLILADFFKGFQLKADPSTIEIDQKTNTATLNGTSFLEGKEYPATFKYTYVDGSWKLNDFLLTNQKGQQTSIAVILKMMVDNMVSAQ